MGLLVAIAEGNTVSVEMMSQSSSTKIERKVIEKNRRNHMKNLYSELNSLLPSTSAKEALPLPDQIDEAIEYIKSLEAKLKMFREKKERLTSCKKRSHSCCTSSAEHMTAMKAPKLDIRQTGSDMEIVLLTGMENQFIFYDIIRTLQEEGVDVVNANYSATRCSIMHVVHAQIKESAVGFAATKVTERLNRLVDGSTNDILLEPELWDFETWEF